MSMTALLIIQQAASELGLPVPAAVNGTSEDTNIQMLALLNAAGYDIISNYQWEEMNRTYKFTIGTDPLITEFALPADFNYFIDVTGWDRTNRWPLKGPVSSQEWQAIVAGQVAAVSRTYYRLVNKKLNFWPAPDSGVRTIALEYASTHWVQDNANPLVFKAMINQDGDIPVLNEWLLIKLLKVKMWAAKGFNTDSLEAEFKVAWNSLTAKSKGSRILSLTSGKGNPFIGTANVPESNFG